MKKFCILAILFSVQMFAAVANTKNQSAKVTASAGSYTFSYTAIAANESVTFAIECSSTSSLTNATLSATGWTITRLDAAPGSAPFGNATGGWMATFGAIAPNTTAATFTAAFTGDSGGNCGNFATYGVGEFSGNDTTGGTTTFDANNHTAPTSTACAISVTPANNNDAIWAFCADNLPTTNWAGAGFSTGAQDANGDGTVFKILSGGSGASQSILWNGSSGTSVAGAIAIKPAGAVTNSYMPPAVE